MKNVMKNIIAQLKKIIGTLVRGYHKKTLWFLPTYGGSHLISTHCSCDVTGAVENQQLQSVEAALLISHYAVAGVGREGGMQRKFKRKGFYKS